MPRRLGISEGYLDLGLEVMHHLWDRHDADVVQPLVRKTLRDPIMSMATVTEQQRVKLRREVPGVSSPMPQLPVQVLFSVDYEEVLLSGES